MIDALSEGAGCAVARTWHDDGLELTLALSSRSLSTRGAPPAG
jgi:hypothetical protein